MVSNVLEEIFPMSSIKFVLSGVVAAACLAMSPVTTAPAQVSIGVNFGPEPSCPYGYYDYAPYNCAPDGYYAPQWFVGGHFVGAGHWFHGPANFHGSVNNHFDPQHGYKGPTPNRGEANPHPGKVTAFKGNESRDGRSGHADDPHK